MKASDSTRPDTTAPWRPTHSAPASTAMTRHVPSPAQHARPDRPAWGVKQPGLFERKRALLKGTPAGWYWAYPRELNGWHSVNDARALGYEVEVRWEPEGRMEAE